MGNAPTDDTVVMEETMPPLGSEAQPVPLADVAPADAPAPARRPRRWAVYGDIHSFKWTEEYGGEELLEETGPIIGVGIKFRSDLIAARAEIFGGVVDYDGQTQDGTPAETDVNYAGMLAECDFLVLSAVNRKRREDGRIRWDPFIGGGFSLWSRDLESTNRAIGYREDWFTLYTHLGLELSVPFKEDCRWFAATRLGYSLYNYESVDLEDIGRGTVELNPGLGPRFRIQTGIDYRGFTGSIYFEWVRFSESDVEDGFLQPESEQAILGLSAGFRW